MPMPGGLRAVDLLLEIPTGEAGMGMGAAQRMMRDAGSAAYRHHPAEYLFRDAGAQMGQARSADEIIDMMDRHGVAIAQISIDPRTPEPALALFERHPGRFFGAVRVDPNEGMEAVRALERTVRAAPRHVKSAALSPCLLYPQVPINDKKAYPVYAKCIELDIPINILVGVPGPRVPMDCQNPYYLDEVCWFFPDLKIVMRHGGDPWTDLCVKLLLKWPNLFYSTTAWAPKHYPRNILDFANKRGAEKVMWSGYYPALSYERVFAELQALALRDHVWKPFLSENARRVFKLEELMP